MHIRSQPTAGVQRACVAEHTEAAATPDSDDELDQEEATTKGSLNLEHAHAQ